MSNSSTNSTGFFGKFEGTISSFFSMKAMSLGLFIFLFAIGAATFIESIYDIQAAKIWIYNAKWFEFLLFYLTLNLIYNIFRYKMWVGEKIAMLLFHLSFIIILLGSAVTRFISFEGLMVIPEGQAIDFIYTAEPHVLIFAQDEKGVSQTIAEKKFMSTVTNNDFDINFELGKRNINLSYVDFQSKMKDSVLIRKSFKSKVLELVTEGRQSNFIGEEESLAIGEFPIIYSSKKVPTNAIQLRDSKEGIEIKTPIELRYLPMTAMRAFRESGGEIADTMYKIVEANKWTPFLEKTLYQIGQNQVVLNNVLDRAKKMLVSTGSRKVGSDFLTVKLNDGKSSKTIRLEGGMSQLPVPVRISMNGVFYQLEYGSIRRPLPFAIGCRDFKLKKYPGSESPSSFESDVTIIDNEKKYKSNRHIFMNNVMDYRGYRFFQSSYTLDDPSTPQNEEGTKLSVNFDWWGTNITYVGYLLMSVAMILALFAPVGRFYDLNSKLKKLKERRKSLTLSLLFLGALSFNSFAKHNHPSANTFYVMSEEHSENLASLLVLDYDGRIVPLHTVCDQLLRKIYRGNEYKKYNAVQTVMSMHMYPNYWMNQKIIQVPSAVRDRLKLKDYASPVELSSSDGQFKWLKEYSEAHQKLESRRDEFDKKLIKLNEKYEVVRGIFMWEYIRILPSARTKGHNWYKPMSIEILTEDTTSSITAFKYLGALDEAAKSNKYGKANSFLAKLKKMQREIGGKEMPSESLVRMEIRYNKMGIFKNTYRGYLTIGLLLLIVFFLNIFINNKEKLFLLIRQFGNSLIIFLFIYHLAGLGMRWAISGHAPWSNGYEALIFIAWATVLCGIIFHKKNAVVLPATAILASLMIFVTEMNLLDPEITPLVPVLKSYWLMIHVAIITSSYGLLGIGAILGLINLLLYGIGSRNRRELIHINITEITYIAEMTMTIGLFMLTIGTFLGGVWANESWGRYWGWDPKETWALVSVLTYAIILHLRLIPRLNGKFLFNVVAFWGYSSIIFTFFGVNFMLTGLHSYAQGEQLAKFPTWLMGLILFFVLLTLGSYLQYRRNNIKE